MKNKDKKPNDSKKKKLTAIGNNFGALRNLFHGSSQVSRKNEMEDSLCFKKTKLPRDTREVGEKYLATIGIDNFALKINKAARFEKDKFKFFSVEKGNKFELRADFSRVPNERQQKAIESLNISHTKFECSPTWRLIVGLGNESVYETSMTLHHIYGIPYIPGSAIKGVARNWVVNNHFEQSPQKALSDETFRLVFGYADEVVKNVEDNSRKGSVIFFDAFPAQIDKANIKMDVMNPHYEPYYSKGKPPADYYDPIPIFFLTLENISFKFFLGIKHKDNKAITSNESILEKTENWLKEALMQHGIGAKTAVGYGVLKEDE